MASPAWGAPALVAALLASLPVQAEEVAAYKRTSVDGYANLQYLSDEQTSTQPGQPRSRQTQSGWRNEIFVMTHGYVYHPNFMTLDIGGGPILHGENFTDDTGNTMARGVLYNFSARANFLRDKPYTGNMFFSHLNPTVSVAPGQVMTQENVRYGFDLSLLAPATPVPLQLGFVRSETQGRGAGRVMDDHVDQLNLTATRSFDALGYAQAQYQASRQASKSGSVDLPVQSSTAEQQALNIYTRLQLGATRQYDLTNAISLNQQKYTLESGSVPALKDTRFMLDGRARHSDKFHTYGFFNYGHSTQGTLETTNRALSAGLSYWPAKTMEYALGFRGEDSKTGGFQTRAKGVDSSIRYEHELPVGALQASYGARFELREQMAATSQTPVLGERMALSGASFAALAHPNVLQSSPVVSNVDRSQTFLSGVDYVLEVVGSEMRVRRLVGGRILEGEPLLVDYSYDNGGAYAYRQLDQTLNLNWSVSRQASVYFRGLNANPRLTSGISTFPLNQVRSKTFGARADLPFNPGVALTVGGNMEREDRNETISPYRRASFDFYVQTDEPVFAGGFLRFSTRRSRINYENSLQNSDLRGNELRYWLNQRFGMTLTATLGMERDSAGLLPRQRQDASLGASWQVRKFMLSANLLRTKESQGDQERNRTFLQVQARREL